MESDQRLGPGHARPAFGIMSKSNVLFALMSASTTTIVFSGGTFLAVKHASAVKIFLLLPFFYKTPATEREGCPAD